MADGASSAGSTDSVNSTGKRISVDGIAMSSDSLEILNGEVLRRADALEVLRVAALHEPGHGRDVLGLLYR